MPIINTKATKTLKPFIKYVCFLYIHNDGAMCHPSTLETGNQLVKLCRERSEQ